MYVFTLHSFFKNSRVCVLCFQIAKLGTQMEAQKLDLIKYLVGKLDLALFEQLMKASYVIYSVLVWYKMIAGYFLVVQVFSAC